MSCDHIVAFHVGHTELLVSQLKEMNQKEQIEALTDTCCGGVMVLNFCPLCGEPVNNSWWLE